MEFGLLALGVALGAGALLVTQRETASPEPPPPAVPAGQPTEVTAEWRIYRGDQGLTGATGERVPDAVAVLWRYETDGPILSSPVLADGKVFVGSNDGRVHCLNAATGEVVWTFETADAVEAPPLVIEGRVYVGSVDGSFHAIDAATGEGIWTYATGEAIHGGANLVRLPDGGVRVLVGSYDHKLHCIDAATGEGVWTVETKNYVNGTPAVSGDAVVFGGCDGEIHVVDALSGETRRDVALGDGVYVASSVAVDEGVVYVAHVGDACVAVAIDSGELRWTYSGEDGFFSSPALAADRLVVAGRDKILRALDRESGEVLWRFVARDGMDSSPVIAGDRVVVGSDDGRVYAVTLSGGEPVWEFSLGGAVTGSVAVGGGLIFVPCEDGSLTALGSRP
jgi:eukaryotic-like serine/threonine-protein kinase